ncbi:SRPBCC family protein [Jatrophihabitans sp.]|uniref:SRPBCC family protein n=1 Tax=Jatrophihabitans sp. TaxID=1932789 RepID=UPI002C17C621|nr:SRPBCC family protein [Jatrophihabitans sp.]
MIATSRPIEASAEQVWTVLGDGWSYAGWVVGASRIRTVEESWPAEGSALAHSVGSWPVLLDDRTEVLTCRPGRLLRLLARTRPLGAALVEIEITERPGVGGCTVTIREDAVSGPALLVPAPVRQLALLARNRESLRRLDFLVRGRAAARH